LQPPNRRRQPPGRSDYWKRVPFATGARGRLRPDRGSPAGERPDHHWNDVRGGVGRLSRSPTLWPREGQAKGCRHEHRERQHRHLRHQTLWVPRARIEEAEGKMMEWQSKALPRYRRLTR